MIKIKHSKYKNTGILFELLVRQITSDTLNNKNSPAKEILQKYFVKTELGREYKLYELLNKKSNLTEVKANILLDSILNSYSTLNKNVLKRQKYNLIKEIKNHYDLDNFFKHKLPNYKTQAALYTLMEIKSSKHSHLEQEVSNKVTLMEYLVSSKEVNKKENIFEEFKSLDKDTRILTFKVLLEKFNEKYNDLSPSKKSILEAIITSADNTSHLKNTYNDNIDFIKKSLNKSLPTISDKATKIKIQELSKFLNYKKSSSSIKDNDLINLLQYHDLLEEIQLTNV